MISIIIPNYNHHFFLKTRIDSILNQTYDNYEIIILDDNSSDESVSLIETYRKDQRISKIIYNETNSGSTFKQWQKGIAAAHGDIIWIAESDDYCEPSFLESLEKLINSNQNNALAYCHSHIVDENNSLLDFKDWRQDLDLSRWDSDYINDGISEIKEYLVYKNIIVNASAVIFKKEAFLKIPPSLFENFRFAGDWMIWASILQFGNICYDHRKLNYFRVHANTTRSIKSIKDEVSRVKEYFKVILYLKDRFKININRSKHFWIIEEWLGKAKLMKSSPEAFLLPPFQLKYKVMFYKALIKKVFRFI
ncbi:glycosyltransferase [Pedobacter ghigonis]|uniref:glycosyltransferase n=1 Tax=Pedobacter ghigonis TaxID=2730403 RepID=UPI0021CFEC95|nr:glycosyltransferase [Pedobacter ghigonis]